MSKDCKKPCGDCPFRKNIEPGNLGGSSVGTYLGQLYGPFRLPCHLQYSADFPGERSKERSEQSMTVPECVGAAMLRGSALELRDRQLPSALLRLSADDTVFESLAAFASHHSGGEIQVVPIPMLERLLQHEFVKAAMAGYVQAVE